LQRLDLPDKIAGRPRFIHDMSLPGMLYGRVARPPSPMARLLEADLTPIEALPGVVALVREGSFLGLVASSEHLAVKALKKLAASARWSESPSLPDQHALPDFLRSQPVETSVIAERASPGSGAAVRTFSADYSRPYLAHASIGPSCAVARVNAGSVEVWSHSQGIFPLRADIAKTLGVPVDAITVQHVEGAGCYGHNGADDAALDAALLARAVPGRPVQLLWTRQDELAWSPFGAAMAVDLQAGVDAEGRIVAWRHQVWSNGHSTRPGRPSSLPTLLAAQHLPGEREPLLGIDVPMANGGGSQRNAEPFYNFAQVSAVTHRLQTMPLRVSSLRSLGAHCNVFAAESFIDEIAVSLGADPLEYRLRHLDDQRARAVLEAAAAMAGWSTRTRSEGRGDGIAFARYKNTGAYCAVVARVEAGRELRVEQLWIAVDVGRVVNPDGVMNQVEGGAIQTVSWVLKEAVRFDRTRVESDSWEAYPILRFTQVPRVDVRVVDRPGEKSLGAGEATHGPVSAAIANALADALGVRVRHLPLTADAITRAALAE
jgi:CO/xanthine dehydrogenase Mo-binding subunit